MNNYAVRSPSAVQFHHVEVSDSYLPRAELTTKQRLGHLHNEFIKKVLKSVVRFHVKRLVTIRYSFVQSIIAIFVKNLWIGSVLKKCFGSF